MQSESEGALVDRRGARRYKARGTEETEADNLTVEFLRLKNDSTRSKVVVVYDDPSRLDGTFRVA